MTGDILGTGRRTGSNMRCVARLLSLISSAMLVAPPCFACELCAVYSAVQARGEFGKGPVLGLAEQFTHSGTIQVDGNEAPNSAGQFLNSSITQIVPGYHVTERFGVEISVPIIARHFRRSEPSGIETGNETGAGDVFLLGNYEVYRYAKMGSTLSCQVYGGVKFPTGSTSRLKEETVEMEPMPGMIPSAVHGHDLTLGTGSYDGLAGATLFGRYEKWFASANLQYSIRSTGDYDYRYANDFIWSIGPGYFFVTKDAFTISGGLNLAGEAKGKDRFRGTSAEDTGVTSVYVGPQIAFTFVEKLSAQVALDLPVLMDNTALQIVPDYRIRAGLTWRF